ncbi:ABC transporter ATP-binding protein [Holospora curviuscula]|uniref:Sulfate/thiosulfate import ATP-binding protein CysA n=1 Tax=Holospora curviuscula TaxID=1082868 RepID=A0A2S5R9E7_9PROT|nr:ATP-binding cassette domain-containing protein [Holospora curviuscula]PPE03755.1 Sulfate/thiosulfate import ATP-binding protein CysA [Holospora curviuscula]
MFHTASKQYTTEKSASEREIVFSVKHLYKSFNAVQVLRDISFDITAGQTIALVGPSGVGKSVLFRCILGLSSVDSGDIVFKGNPVLYSKYNTPGSFFKEMGVVFQHSALFDGMSVRENVAFGFPPHLMSLVDQSLDQVEFPSCHRNAYPSTLSGGMRRRVSIARAIVRRPKILFLDEPTAGLDPVASHHISFLIHQIQTAFKVTCVTITHDILRLPLLAEHILFLSDQQLVWQGNIQKFLSSCLGEIHSFVQFGTQQSLSSYPVGTVDNLSTRHEDMNVETARA